MTNRRNILGGILATLASPKSLFTSRAGGYVPSARTLSRGTIPLRAIKGEYIRIPEYTYINRIPKLLRSRIIHKNNIEPYTNSQDTSIVFCDFGVSIYVDPSGLYKER